jgi:GR25 family glycosyltransferase involved in LPS biosynthesis
MKKYFEAIYIINLPSRVDRKGEMQEQLAKAALDIDGNYVRVFSALRPSGTEGFPTIGTRGCFLSHLAVLTDARDRGVGSVLILEDDCNFVRDIATRLEEIFSMRLKDASDFFYGGALNTGPEGKALSGYLKPDQKVVGAHFLSISAKALPGLVEYLEAMLRRPAGDPLGGPMHVDGAYSWFRAAHPEFLTFVAGPEIAYQRSSATDIHRRKWYESTRAAQWVLRRLRRAKNKFLDSKL